MLQRRMSLIKLINSQKTNISGFQPEINVDMAIDDIFEDVEKQLDCYNDLMDLENQIEITIEDALNLVMVPHVVEIEISLDRPSAFINFVLDNAATFAPHVDCHCSKYTRSNYQQGEYKYALCSTSPHFEIISLLRQNKIINAVNYFNDFLAPDFNTRFVCK